MSGHDLVDVRVSELEKTVYLLDSLVESYKLEMALLHHKHNELVDQVRQINELIRCGQTIPAHEKLAVIVGPPLTLIDPIEKEIERVT